MTVGWNCKTATWIFLRMVKPFRCLCRDLVYLMSMAPEWKGRYSSAGLCEQGLTLHSKLPSDVSPMNRFCFSLMAVPTSLEVVGCIKSGLVCFWWHRSTLIYAGLNPWYPCRFRGWWDWNPGYWNFSDHALLDRLLCSDQDGLNKGLLWDWLVVWF